MSTILHPPRVQSVQPNEICDAACPAPAKVAILYPLKNSSEYGRLVFCAHHFASLDSSLKDRAIIHHESQLNH